MHYALAILAFVASVSAQTATGTPPSCQTDYPSNFEIAPVNVSSSAASRKRALENRVSLPSAERLQSPQVSLSNSHRSRQLLVPRTPSSHSRAVFSPTRTGALVRLLPTTNSNSTTLSRPVASSMQAFRSAATALSLWVEVPSFGLATLAASPTFTIRAWASSAMRSTSTRSHAAAAAASRQLHLLSLLLPPPRSPALHRVHRPLQSPR